MINQIYRLVSPRQFEVSYRDESLHSGNVAVRPTHLSICAADQRYYTGSRGQEVLSRKLPMSLIHEAIGTVAYDPGGEFAAGTRVVMIPNTPVAEDGVIAENYLRTSRFRSSGFDGFMQDYVFLPKHRIVPLFDELNDNVASFLELISVSMHALRRFEQKSHVRKDTFGVWGDGNLGYISALLLKKRYPGSKVFVFGKTGHKLSRFSFADETYLIDQIPDSLRIDHAVECAGGIGSQSAINQIIDFINPEGTISILGVSEYPVEINTRMILEKGLSVVGSSRSGRVDFIETLEFLQQNEAVIDYLQTLIGSVNTIHTMRDILDAFELDLTTDWGKTVMEWNI
ncbi:ribitol-5-phosphate dehydrogenase [Alicyclobacillus sp. SO9]|uniref:ribitol-5-phosphate dehydrogenase n=1 Tax=Alicyclobacillus sp. SO9 TaxID=2665646 RepID=UPI0018E90379|nr:ribitol-5-phosphate dehydrogenase [Alicyclobacillus sp. SO9]QQE79068.1 alcohol dehydrogenase catalytic domain-containing protein [Alicyclobacillus sp. SO9]